MKYYRSVIVKQAQTWVGKKESDGSHKEIIDVYNSHKPLARGYKLKYTSAWCSGFASAVAIKCGYTAIIPTEVGCEKHINLFKKMNSWVEDDSYVPSAGDYIFYDWEDSGSGENKNSANHVGIVEKVSGNTITVIEGNYSNAVKRRTIKVNGKYIRGYGVPKYDDEPVTKDEETPKKTVDELAQEVLDGKWGNGADRKKRLTEAGYNYSEVQAKVNEILHSSKPKLKSVDEVAREVIQGKWGNGQDRKNRLTKAGYNYSEVQKRVNQLLK